jgi:hypothetical protein
MVADEAKVRTRIEIEIAVVTEQSIEQTEAPKARAFGQDHPGPRVPNREACRRVGVPDRTCGTTEGDRGDGNFGG